MNQNEAVISLESVEVPVITRTHEDEAGAKTKASLQLVATQIKKGPLTGQTVWAPPEVKTDQDKEALLAFIGEDTAFDILTTSLQRDFVAAFKFATDYDVVEGAEGKKIADIKNIDIKKLIDAIQDATLRGETKKELLAMLTDVSTQMSEAASGDLSDPEVVKKLRFLGTKFKSIKESIDKRSRKKDDEDEE